VTGIVTALLLLALQSTPAATAHADRVAQCQSLAVTPSAPITVHGRLYGANGGGSGFRVWIVGTKRIVWLTPKIDPAMPDAIRQAFAPFEQDLYGDFTLVPLAPNRPGVMREVCFVSGKNLEARPAQHPAGPPGGATPPRQWSEAESRWLETWWDSALDALMPVARRDGQNIAYRRYRDLHHAIPELSFSIELAERPAGHAASATLTEPVGASIQEQLLELHAREPEATLQTLLPRITLRRLRTSDRPCGALDAQLRALPRVTPVTLRTNVIVLHPLVQRLVISTTAIHADVTVFETTVPIAKWADRTIAAIRTCGAATRPPP
jgi:hypothetical protein